MDTIENNHSYCQELFENVKQSKDLIIGVTFERCRFKECQWTESTFSNCRFIDCDIEDSDMNLVHWMNSRLLEVRFSHCKLTWVDWTLASWDHEIIEKNLIFRHCEMSHSDFSGLNLFGIILEECLAYGVDFREANIAKGSFCFTDFNESMFQHTNLREADFTGAKNYRIDIMMNLSHKAKFTFPEAKSLLDCLDPEFGQDFTLGYRG